MLIDWIKLHFIIDNYVEWKRLTDIKRYIHVEEDTGEIKEENNGSWKLDIRRKLWFKTILHNGKFQRYDFVIRETKYKEVETGKVLPTKYFLEISGSPHCNAYTGKNHQRFYYSQLIEQIQLLYDTFKLDLTKTEIHGVEVGINVLLQFPVYSFIKNCLLQYQGKSFVPMKKNKRTGKVIGFEVQAQTQYTPKAYDKGKQHDLSGNLFRWELHFDKMQPVQTALGFNDNRKVLLSDLISITVLKKLFIKLIASWDEVVLYDEAININAPMLSNNDKQLLSRGCYRDYWEQLKQKDKERFKYVRKRFRWLVEKHGSGVHNEIKNAMLKEFDVLSNCAPNLPVVQREVFPNLTNSVRGKIGEIHISINNSNDEYNNGTQELINTSKRVCASCGADISHQRSNSKFCSSKYVGKKKAKACRNKDSNKRNSEKRKSKLLDIKPANNKITVTQITPEESRIKLRSLLLKMKEKYADTG